MTALELAKQKAKEETYQFPRSEEYLSKLMDNLKLSIDRAVKSGDECVRAARQLNVKVEELNISLREYGVTLNKGFDSVLDKLADLKTEIDKLNERESNL